VVRFFVNRRSRRRGLTLALLKAAVAYAHSEGAKIVEGYPVGPCARLYTYMGSPSAFHSAGFRDVTPPGARRSFMHYFLKPSDGHAPQAMRHSPGWRAAER
jgi:GNAT superfamily N-acetyltransferase